MIFGEASYPFAEMQSVYFTAQADLAVKLKSILNKFFIFFICQTWSGSINLIYEKLRF